MQCHSLTRLLGGHELQIRTNALGTGTFQVPYTPIHTVYIIHFTVAESDLSRESLLSWYTTSIASKSPTHIGRIFDTFLDRAHAAFLCCVNRPLPHPSLKQSVRYSTAISDTFSAFCASYVCGKFAPLWETAWARLGE